MLMETGIDYPEIREQVARLCAGFPGGYWRRLEAEAAYPEAFVRALTESGYLAALIPESFGGAGLPLRAAAVILETIHAQGCSAAACHAQMYTMGTLLRHGSPAQQERYLPAIAKGELRLQAFGVTEPDSGSDTPALRTRAVRDGDHYVVTGQKIWTSRALHSDLMLLLVRTTALEDCRKRSDGLTVLLVDLRQSVGHGLTIRPLETMINHQTTEVFIDGLKVPAENVVGEAGRGFRYILDGMNAERILLAGEALGDGRFFIDRAVAYAKQRKVFGRPIGQNQGIQFPLARARVNLDAAELMARHAATLFAAGEPCGEAANSAKLLTSEAAWQAAEACFQTFGGFAFAKDYDIERKWRDCRLFQTAPISTNMILAYLAQTVLGLPRGY